MTRDKDARPERWLPRSAWRVEDVLRHSANGTKPESAEFKEWRQRRLEDAGIGREDGIIQDDHAEEASGDEMTADDHLKRIQKARRNG